MAGRKASLSRNPLSNPTTSIQALAVEFQDYMHFPDPAPLYAVMGAVAANMLPGNPVWLMLIGPPSCGKTTLLETLMGIPHTHAASSLTGQSALLSGVGQKDRTKGSTGGLLRQIGAHGALVLKDFTSMMTMNRDSLDGVMSALREIYDGRFDRSIGEGGGRTMTWEGKLSILAGCTQAIDRHHQIASEMGERWVYFRYPDSDGFGEINRTLSTTKSPADKREQMRELVRCFFDALGLEWGGEGQTRRAFSMAERMRLASIATFAARARSAVYRHSYSREVEDMPQYEAPTRLASSLGQIYLGMEAIGVEEKERWRVVLKIAEDCMPQLRAAAIRTVRVGVESTFDEIRAACGMCGRNTVNRVVEDLEILGVLEKVEGKRMWVVSEWANRELKSGWGK